MLLLKQLENKSNLSLYVGKCKLKKYSFLFNYLVISLILKYDEVHILL